MLEKGSQWSRGASGSKLVLFLMATFLMMKALMGVSHSFAEFPNLLCLHLICRNVPALKREIEHV